MKTLRLYYATNRKHEGADRWEPTGYGTKFSDDGAENLRFGRVELDVDPAILRKHLGARIKGMGTGNGNGLADALKPLVARARIKAYLEAIDPTRPDTMQPGAKFGSVAMFADLKETMMKCSDVLVYIHGFNVSWSDAVASALALQEQLNRADEGKPEQEILVVLFTWPSNGKALPYVSYKSDRVDARASGGAVGRAFLKARDFLQEIRTRDKKGEDEACSQELHLLCHSMGNFVLQCALERMFEFTPGNTFPRMFEHIFLCAPDVDDTVLEAGQPLGSVHELAQHVTVYANRDDVAMYTSDYTKGNPERLGHRGPARPALLHNKVHSVDCSPIVGGLVEHSYYMDGTVNQDLRYSIASVPFDARVRKRTRDRDLPNVWKMK